MISEKLKKYRINQNNRYRKKLNSRKEIMEEMEDASKEQKQEFQKEIEQLKAI